MKVSTTPHSSNVRPEISKFVTDQKANFKPTVPLHTIVAPKLKFAILSEM